MEKMLMATPLAVTGTSTHRRAIPSSSRPWSIATAAHAFCMNTALKAHGSRRLPETPT